VNYHLVILKKPYLDLILSGRKTIESRPAKTQTAPWRVTSPAGAPGIDDCKDDLNGEG